MNWLNNKQELWLSNEYIKIFSRSREVTSWHPDRSTRIWQLISTKVPDLTPTLLATDRRPSVIDDLSTQSVFCTVWDSVGSFCRFYLYRNNAKSIEVRDSPFKVYIYRIKTSWKNDVTDNITSLSSNFGVAFSFRASSDFEFLKDLKKEDRTEWEFILRTYNSEVENNCHPGSSFHSEEATSTTAHSSTPYKLSYDSSASNHAICGNTVNKQDHVMSRTQIYFLLSYHWQRVSHVL